MRINYFFVIFLIGFAIIEFAAFNAIGETCKEYKTTLITPITGVILSTTLLTLGYFSRMQQTNCLGYKFYNVGSYSFREFLRRRHFIFYTNFICIVLGPFFWSLFELGDIVKEHTYTWIITFNVAFSFVMTFFLGWLSRREEEKKNQQDIYETTTSKTKGDHRRVAVCDEDTTEC